MKSLSALFCGVVFGAGLALSGMVDPAVVQGFLDLPALLSGHWNPALAAVMAGAVPTTFLLYRLAGAKVPPPSGSLDFTLIIGAILFGLGWGLVGICPGPALEAWVEDPYVLVFLFPMFAGLVLSQWLVRRFQR